MQSISKHDRELFLVLEELSEQLSFFLLQLEPMGRSSEGALLLGVDALYDRGKDVALLRIRFDPDVLNAKKRRDLVKLATKGGLPILDPLRLETEDRRRFYVNYLRKLEQEIDDQPSPKAALYSLGQYLGLINHPNSVVDVPIRRKKLRNSALGSESEFSKYGQAPAIPNPTGTPSKRYKRKITEQGHTAQSIPPHLPMPLPPPPSAMPEISDIVPHNVVEMRSPPPPPPPRARSSAPVASLEPRNTTRQDLKARFQRGDTWMVARLRNLTTREVRLAASAAPPMGTVLQISLSDGSADLRLQGKVIDVVNTENSGDGSTSFRVELHNLSGTSRAKLVALLRMAQHNGLSLTPPPARSRRRFAIRWPVMVIAEGSCFPAQAHDISEKGMFMATDRSLRVKSVAFGIHVDGGALKVQGRARVARMVSEGMALTQGLSAGYGLAIEDFSTQDRQRFSAFVERVQVRSQRHILIASAGRRSLQLANCFEAAGYSVVKADSVQRMQNKLFLSPTTRGGNWALDLAVVDHVSLSSKERQIFESTFLDGAVPTLGLLRQTPDIARETADEMMAVR